MDRGVTILALWVVVVVHPRPSRLWPEDTYHAGRNRFDNIVLTFGLFQHTNCTSRFYNLLHLVAAVKQKKNSKINIENQMKVFLMTHLTDGSSI